MPGPAQRFHDVEFGLPLVYLLLGVPLGRVRGHQVRVHEHQDAQLFHSAIHLRREPKSACIVLAVNSTVKSITSFCSGPTARKFSSRQRAMMSSSTASSVS